MLYVVYAKIYLEVPYLNCSQNVWPNLMFCYFIAYKNINALQVTYCKHFMQSTLERSCWGIYSTILNKEWHILNSVINFQS